jgi:hypothetical protein
MEKSKELEVIKAMREVAYFTFIDALKGLKDATRIIDERVQKDGPKANYSIDSDLLSWSQAVWKSSNRLYNIDQVLNALLDKDGNLSIKIEEKEKDDPFSDIR